MVSNTQGVSIRGRSEGLCIRFHVLLLLNEGGCIFILQWDPEVVYLSGPANTSWRQRSWQPCGMKLLVSCLRTPRDQGLSCLFLFLNVQGCESHTVSVFVTFLIAGTTDLTKVT